MFQDVIISLISLFVIEPLQTELNDKLVAARAPQAVVSQIAQCARTATPVLAERVISDPWWGITTTASVWAGISSPERVLREVAPSCEPALQAARPFLEGKEA
jgi:hypothetical protein